MTRVQHPEPFCASRRSANTSRSARSSTAFPSDRDEAYQLYHELMSRPPEVQAKMPADPIPSAEVAVSTA